jgi:hypothetical protein
MARHDFFVDNPTLSPTTIEDPDDNIVSVDRVLRLKQKGADGKWNPLGTYGSGQVLLETWKPTLMSELLGFWAVVDEPGTDRALFRLSPDEGTTELYWDGATWRAPVDDTEWNAEDEVDEGIANFPFETSISVVLRLESGTGATTPRFHGFYVFYEVFYDCTEDLLRSVFEKIDEEVRIPALDQFELVTPDNELEVTDQPWEIVDSIRVYNLTDDPARQTNLFASIDGTTITMTSPQEGILEVRYHGKLRRDQIHISTDGDFQLQSLPAIVIMPQAQDRVRDDHESRIEEQLRALSVVRMRTQPARHSYTLALKCISQFSLHDKKLADATRRAFDTREWVRSLAIDEEFELVGLENVNQTNQTQNQLFTRTVQVIVSVLEWLPSFRDVPMVKKLTYRQRVAAEVDFEVEVTE